MEQIAAEAVKLAHKYVKDEFPDIDDLEKKHLILNTFTNAFEAGAVWLRVKDAGSAQKT